MSVAAVCAALGHPLRVELMERLCQGEASITALTGDTGVTRQAITRHLGVLADAGLIESRRSGREHLWALQPQSLNAAQRWMNQISERWDQRLARLKALVERD